MGANPRTSSSAPPDWKQMDDFAAGIDTNRLPVTDRLASAKLSLRLDDGTRAEFAFTGVEQVDWRRVEADGAERSGAGWAEAIEVRDGVFFIDQTFADRPNESAVTIVSLSTRRVMQIVSTIAEELTPGVPRVSQTFRAGVLTSAAGVSGQADSDGGEPTGEAPAPSRDLIGWRALYRYSPNHLYEHIYLSSERYAWQCLVGEQKGHGDVDLTTTWKFGEGLYVFTFREFIIPVAATWLYDLDAMRTTGKFFGIGEDGSVSNRPGGAYITSLGRAQYPSDGQPV